jgi:8-oxo-dGTP pyrophosphatase MutT (NUDIX family)
LHADESGVNRTGRIDVTSPADTPRLAATVLIVRDAPELQVLMVRRHARMAFGASAWVFPGGKVAGADSAENWPELAGGPLSGAPLALRVAAARETFEESGLLLARRISDGRAPDLDVCSRLDERRADVEADPSLFPRLLHEAGLRLALDHLVHFAHWITPSFEPRRFDTHFFLVAAPEAQCARHDGREAVDHVWEAPSALLERRARGEARLMFPTRLNLSVLARSHSAADAEQAARSRRVVTVEPQVVERDGVKSLLIPEEAGYGLTEERMDQVLG